MTARERYQAESLREIPGFIDFLHYLLMMNAGALTEYRQFKEWINYEGNIKEMKTFSNWVPTFRRLFELALCVCFATAIITFITPYVGGKK